MTDAEKADIAEMVAIGAVRFDFLRTSPERKIIFKWEDALRFEGNTAPYVQYSHARCARVMEKVGAMASSGAAVDYSALSSKEDLRLVKKIAEFPRIAENAARDRRPHYVAEYVFDLAQDFSTFYAVHSLMKSEERERTARLRLVAACKQTIKNGLWILGIAAPERM